MSGFDRVRQDVSSIREGTLYLRNVLNKSTPLNHWDCIWLWRAALSLRTVLEKAIVQLESLSVLTLEESKTILDDVMEFEVQMQESFELVAKKKPEADALKIMGWQVSPWVKPFVLELAENSKKWIAALESKTPPEGHPLVNGFATRLEVYFSKAINAYAD